ncbi:anti-sigma factor domain-containing protein [Streptomyces sp. NPDC012510]|uniref:anti-sigma factor n=1 Tax=Streptomyces sp. NPDC012510 TaxID=3364838 RepID=UPI0036EC3884
MTTDDPHDFAGAYALDALGPEERDTFRRHCAQCPDCAREIALHQEVAARLAMAVADTSPPGLRERVLAEAARTPQLPAAAPDQADRRPRRRSPPRLLRLALAASLAAAAALGGTTVWQQQAATQARQAEQETRRETQSQSAALARLLAAPDTTLTTKPISYGGTGTVAVSPLLNQAAYFCENLAPLPSGKTYQLWYVAPGDETRSAGLLPSTADAQAVALPPPDTASSLAITVEPSKGSSQPTMRPFATWPLSAS